MHSGKNSFIKFRKHILPKQVTFINHLVAARVDIKIVTDKLKLIRVVSDNYNYNNKGNSRAVCICRCTY